MPGVTYPANPRLTLVSGRAASVELPVAVGREAVLAQSASTPVAAISVASLPPSLGFRVGSFEQLRQSIGSGNLASCTSFASWSMPATPVVSMRGVPRSPMLCSRQDQYPVGGCSVAAALATAAYRSGRHSAAIAPSVTQISRRPVYFEGAEAGDPMDQLFTLYLMAVAEEARSQLKVKKLGPGRYEMDGRQLRVRWSGLGGRRAPNEAQLLVRELHNKTDALTEDAGDDELHEQSLDSYLQSAANVACASNGAAAVARVPKEMRLTFDGGGSDSHQLESMDVEERCESMRKACEEARLREAAAAAYQVGQVLRLAQAAAGPPPVVMARRSTSPRAVLVRRGR